MRGVSHAGVTAQPSRQIQTETLPMNAARTAPTLRDLTLTCEEGDDSGPPTEVTRWNTLACLNLLVDVLQVLLNLKIRYCR
jgi:hypothetical protein